MRLPKALNWYIVQAVRINANHDIERRSFPMFALDPTVVAKQIAEMPDNPFNKLLIAGIAKERARKKLSLDPFLFPKLIEITPESAK